MDGEQFVQVLERLIGASNTSHCIRKVGGKLDEIHHLDIKGFEALAFYIYSNASTWHVMINRALWSSDASSDVLVFAHVLDGAILKLPALKGRAATVYRGIDVENVEGFAAQHAVGQTVTIPAFTSATYDLGGAFGGNVLFIIRSRSARAIWFMSAHFTEEEALLPTGCVFTVISTARRGSRLVIELEEVGGR